MIRTNRPRTCAKLGYSNFVLLPYLSSIHFMRLKTGVLEVPERYTAILKLGPKESGTVNTGKLKVQVDSRSWITDDYYILKVGEIM